MIATGLVLAGLAALVHVYIFTLESLTWTSERTRAVFGTTEESAAATRELAFNQGFYNLFLAMVTTVGIVVVCGNIAVGATLVLAGTGTMLLAALVLALSSPDKVRSAVAQGIFPLLSMVAMVIGLLA